MDYPVKHFESDDAGVPSLDRTTPGSLISVLKACLIDGYNLQPFDSLEMDGEHGKANFPGNHGFREHQVIEISGASGAAWNGQHRVTATGTQWIKFEVEGEPAAESGAGLEIKAAPVGGWEIAHINAEETRAAFRSTDPASTQMYWYLDDRRSADIEGSPTSSTEMDWRYLRGALNMPDIDTREESWGSGFVLAGSSSRGTLTPYDLIADSRTVYLVTNPMESSGAECRTVHAFGDFNSLVPGDPHAAMMVGARWNNDTTTDGKNGSYWSVMFSDSSTAAGLSLTLFRDAYAVPGSQVNFAPFGIGSSRWIGGPGESNFNPSAYPTLGYPVLAIHGPLALVQDPYSDQQALRGCLPGVAQPLHHAPLLHRDMTSVAGRRYKALTHSAYIWVGGSASPDKAQTLFDITGPWRG